jgi:SAM-dependent methyltransferase
MIDLNEDFWSSRYREGADAWDLGGPSTPLKEYIDGLTDKSLKILIPGAGNSHEAEYLWALGFTNTHVIDLAKEPLENLKNRAKGFPESQAIQGDFFEHKGQYDLVLEQTFFCAISPTLRADYAKQMATIIKPGGKLAGVLFNAPMNEDHPPFGGTAEEYKTYFDPYFDYSIYEACRNSIDRRMGTEWFIELVRK